MIPHISDRLVGELAEEPLGKQFAYNPSALYKGLVSCVGSDYCNLAVIETKSRAVETARVLERKLGDTDPGNHFCDVRHEALRVMVKELDRRVDQRVSQLVVMLDKADRAMSERLATMNEFREALKDQANRMATIKEKEALRELVEDLRRERATREGRVLLMTLFVAGATSVGTAFLLHLLGVIK